MFHLETLLNKNVSENVSEVFQEANLPGKAIYLNAAEERLSLLQGR